MIRRNPERRRQSAAEQVTSTSELRFEAGVNVRDFFLDLAQFSDRPPAGALHPGMLQHNRLLVTERDARFQGLLGGALIVRVLAALQGEREIGSNASLVTSLLLPDSFAHNLIGRLGCICKLKLNVGPVIHHLRGLTARSLLPWVSQLHCKVRGRQRTQSQFGTSRRRKMWVEDTHALAARSCGASLQLLSPSSVSFSCAYTAMQPVFAGKPNMITHVSVGTVCVGGPIGTNTWLFSRKAATE